MFEKLAAYFILLMKTKKCANALLYSFLLFFSTYLSAQKFEGVHLSGGASIHSSDEAFNNALKKSADENIIILSAKMENDVERIVAVSANKDNHLATKSGEKNSQESEVIKIGKKQKKEQLAKKIPKHKVNTRIFVVGSESSSVLSCAFSGSENAVAGSSGQFLFGKGLLNEKFSINKFLNLRSSIAFEVYSKKYSFNFNQDFIARPPPVLIFS